MCGVSRGNGWRYSDNINRGWCGVVWCGVVWWVGGLVEGIGRGYKRNGPVSPTEPRVARRPWSYASRHGASRWRMRRPGRSGRSRCPRAVDLVLVLVLVLSLSLSPDEERDNESRRGGGDGDGDGNAAAGDPRASDIVRPRERTKVEGYISSATQARNRLAARRGKWGEEEEVGRGKLLRRSWVTDGDDELWSINIQSIE